MPSSRGGKNILSAETTVLRPAARSDQLDTGVTPELYWQAWSGHGWHHLPHIDEVTG